MNKKYFIKTIMLLSIIIGNGLEVKAQTKGTTLIDMDDRYQIQRSSSFLSFDLTFNTLPVIKGSIETYQGTLFYDPQNEQATSATLRFVTGTFSTHYQQRDDMLKGVDFLDVENYPEIWFQSTSAKPTDSGIDLTGNLIIKDISKEVTVKLEKPFMVPHQPGQMDYLYVKGGLNINRNDFNLGSGTDKWYNSPSFDGNPQLSENITIEFLFFCNSYNADYLDTVFSKKRSDGSDNPVGLVFNEIKTSGIKSGNQMIKGLKKSEITPKFYADLGWVLMKNNLAKEAVEMFETGLKIDPESKVNRLRLGDAYITAGYFDKAVAHIEKEMMLNPALTHMPELLKLLKGDLMNKSSIDTK